MLLAADHIQRHIIVHFARGFRVHRQGFYRRRGTSSSRAEEETRARTYREEGARYTTSFPRARLQVYTQPGRVGNRDRAARQGARTFAGRVIDKDRHLESCKLSRGSGCVGGRRYALEYDRELAGVATHREFNAYVD